MRSVDQVWHEARQRGLPPAGWLAVVDASLQTLYLVSHEGGHALFLVSTSRNGLGCRIDSYQTPAGFHEVRERIGEKEPLYQRFVDRRPCGVIDPSTGHAQEDLILTRILWLSGLEDGLNRGRQVDSHERYIYLHGTNHEDRLGEAASRGCIRMGNHEVAALFEMTREQPLWCWIGELRD